MFGRFFKGLGCTIRIKKKTLFFVSYCLQYNTSSGLNMTLAQAKKATN